MTIAAQRAALAAWLRDNPDATTRQIAAATGSTRRNLLTDLPAIGAVHRWDPEALAARWTLPDGEAAAARSA